MTDDNDNPDNRIEFAEEYVADILRGEKGATVRYPVHKFDFTPGDRVPADMEDGTEFATLEVRRTATVMAVEVHAFLDVFGDEYEHNTDDTDELLDALSEHYSGTGVSFAPGTYVQVICFETVDD